MKYTNSYSSPLGKLLMTADDIGLTGLWFENQLHCAYHLDSEHIEKELPVFEQTKYWLDVYFSSQTPNFKPPVHIIGTSFQIAVWSLLEQIPYGQTTTYGDIAAQIAARSYNRHLFSNCSMESLRTDSLWSDNNLRRHRSSNRQAKRYYTYVSASCRTGCWTQQNFHYHSLSPRNWQKWNTYRICWRVGQKNRLVVHRKNYLTSPIIIFSTTSPQLETRTCAVSSY